MPKAPLWGNWKVEIWETCLRPATAGQAETKLVCELDVYADRRFSKGVRCDLWKGMPLALTGRSYIIYGLARLKKQNYGCETSSEEKFYLSQTQQNTKK